jgi:demethylmenaquinone methyltransferase/2-methoxy-6-polyprenyl-1,4-benzoquinol methylase
MTLREFHRVLKSGGQLLALEFSIPDRRIIRRMYLFYLRHILPFVGGILSPDREAYRYLSRSVESFPYGEDFCARIRAAGFVDVRRRPLTWGIATLYLGEKLGA